MIVASIDIRREAAEASVSGLPGLLFGADVGNRPPGDAVEARGGLIVSHRAWATRTDHADCSDMKRALALRKRIIFN